MLNDQNYFTYERYQNFKKIEWERACLYAQLRRLEFNQNLDDDSVSAHLLHDTSRPDLDSIRAFSRIKLACPWAGSHIDPGIEELWAVVIAVEDERLEAYIFQTDGTTHGHVTIDKNCVVDCLPPLASGEPEPGPKLNTDSTFQHVPKRQPEFDKDIPF